MPGERKPEKEDNRASEGPERVIAHRGTTDHANTLQGKQQSGQSDYRTDENPYGLLHPADSSLLNDGPPAAKRPELYYPRGC
jgi:hypothetical protein